MAIEKAFIERCLKSALQTVFSRKGTKLTGYFDLDINADLIAAGLMQSSNMPQIIDLLQKEFKIKIDSKDLTYARSTRDFLDYIWKHKGYEENKIQVENKFYSEAGYVYALINSSIKDLIKVGKTERDPEDRAQELSAATGVPTPFVVAFKIYVNDCSKAEGMLHVMLEKKGYRVSENKEFFNAPLDEVIESMFNIKQLMEEDPASFSDPCSTIVYDEYDENKVRNDSIIEGLLDEAEKYEYGVGETLQDIDKAINLYNKAAKLGSACAYYCLGEIYNWGKHTNYESEDYKTALEYYTRGAEKNTFFSGNCYKQMAYIYFYEIKHPENCRKCWHKYFAHDDFKGSEEEKRRGAVKEYIEHMLEFSLPVEDKYITQLSPEGIKWIFDKATHAIEKKPTSNFEKKMNDTQVKVSKYIERYLK